MQKTKEMIMKVGGFFFFFLICKNGCSDRLPLNVKGGKDYHHNLHHNIVWLHIPVVFCRINAFHKYFFPTSSRHIHIQHNQAHFTIAYDKSVFLYGEVTF